MSRRSIARRLVSLLGALLLIGGVVAAAVLFVLGPRYRERQVEQLARGLVGCVTPLVFTETGTFYVYQEVAGPELEPNGCPATPRPGDFGVEISAPSGPVHLTDDRTVSYNVDGSVGMSIRRFEVTETGVYSMTVTGPDAGTRAAIGPDPDDVISTYRTWALIAGIGGVVAGLALLVGSSLGGRRAQPEPAGPATAAFAPPGFEPPVPLAETTSAPSAPGGFGPPQLEPPVVEEAPHTSATPAADPWAPPTTDERRG